MRRYFLIFFFICTIQPINAQDKDLLNSNTRQVDSFVNNADILSDTTLYIHTIQFSKDTIAAWQNSEKYSYVKNLDSLLKTTGEEASSRSSNRRMSLLQQIFSSGIIQLVLWALVIGTIVFILYRLFIIRGVFQQRSSSLRVNEIQEGNAFHDSADFTFLIRQSVSQADYRMAVRYLFLQTLSRLFNKGLLERSADKTNYLYAEEIQADKKNDFAKLVLNYEYIWYGNLHISHDKFRELERSYHLFCDKI